MRDDCVELLDETVLCLIKQGFQVDVERGQPLSGSEKIDQAAVDLAFEFPADLTSFLMRSNGLSIRVASAAGGVAWLDILDVEQIRTAALSQRAVLEESLKSIGREAVKPGVVLFARVQQVQLYLRPLANGSSVVVAMDDETIDWIEDDAPIADSFAEWVSRIKESVCTLRGDFLYFEDHTEVASWSGMGI